MRQENGFLAKAAMIGTARPAVGAWIISHAGRGWDSVRYSGGSAAHRFRCRPGWPRHAASFPQPD